MNLSKRGVIYVDYPVSEKHVTPYRSVLSLCSKQHKGGQLTLSYTDAFKMGFAGVIDRSEQLKETEKEIVAVERYIYSLDEHDHSADDIEFLRAEKYFVRACEKLDYECIYVVGKFLITQPIVFTKKAIAEDLKHICEQIEWSDSCSLDDIRNTLYELKRHVFNYKFSKSNVL